MTRIIEIKMKHTRSNTTYTLKSSNLLSTELVEKKKLMRNKKVRLAQASGKKIKALGHMGTSKFRKFVITESIKNVYRHHETKL